MHGSEYSLVFNSRLFFTLLTAITHYLESWSQNGPVCWPLADSGDEKVDVVDVGIQQLESVDDLLGDQVLHLVEGVDFAQSAVSTEGSISCETKKKKCFAIMLVFNSR